MRSNVTGLSGIKIRIILIYEDHQVILDALSL